MYQVEIFTVLDFTYREDRELNQQRAPATKKISMLSIVMTQLRKADLQVSRSHKILKYRCRYVFLKGDFILCEIIC